MPIKKTKIAGRECYVKQCHPKSGWGKMYMFKGFVCPFCGNDKDEEFLLEITEELDEKTKKICDGHRVEFSCSDALTFDIDRGYLSHCGKVIGLGWYGSGIPLEYVIKSAIKDYSYWKCNKKKKYVEKRK